MDRLDYAHGSALRCVECGLVSSGKAEGWQALLTIGNEVGVYCPECAEREFGEE